MNLEWIGLSLKRVHFVRLLLFCILANAGVFAFLIIPRQEYFARVQTRHTNLKSEIVAREKENRELQQRVKDLKQAELDMHRIYESVLMPRETGVTEIRLELEDLASSLRVGRRNFSYNYGSAEFGLLPFTLSVPIQGSYREIRNFINEIELSEHFLILDQVILSSQRDASVLNLNFRISTYLTLDQKGT